jgi:predicted tellurium resistance membrane protein TerC
MVGYLILICIGMQMFLSSVLAIDHAHNKADKQAAWAMVFVTIVYGGCIAVHLVDQYFGVPTP